MKCDFCPVKSEKNINLEINLQERRLFLKLTFEDSYKSLLALM